MSQTAKDTLDTMLGYLGFFVEIQEQQRDGNTVLQIRTSEPERLIGSHQEVMDDLQYLVNRVTQACDPEAPRVVVDVEHHRLMRDDALVERMRHLAEAVRNTGRALQTEPLNAYDRRLVHNAFKDDSEIMTWSPPDQARIKRITLKKRS